MQLSNTFIHLIGHAGVGKYTTGLELARTTGAKLVDNHLINNPLLNVIEQDGKTPLPDVVWREAGKIRKSVLFAIREISPAHYSFVFTNVLFEDDTDKNTYDQVLRLARARKAAFFPVVLSCGPQELKKRKVAPGRREQFKDINADNVESLLKSREILKIKHPNLLTLDVTDITAEQSAGKILEHVRSRHAD